MLAPLVRVNRVSPGVAPIVLRGVCTVGQQEQWAVLEGTEEVLPLAKIAAAADFGLLYAFLASEDAQHPPQEPVCRR